MSKIAKDTSDIDGGVIYNSLDKSYYYWNSFYYNQSLPKTKSAEDSGGLPVTGSGVVDKSTSNTVNVIGLLAALVFSLVIIIIVAVIISKIRKRQDSSNSQTSSINESKPEVVVATVHKEINQDQDENQSSFTITFTEIPKEIKGIKQWIPKTLRPKPKTVNVEKLKRELGQIYVY